MNLLTLVLALPLAGFLIALLMPRNSPQSSRMWALIASLVTFVASLGLLAWFNRETQHWKGRSKRDARRAAAYGGDAALYLSSSVREERGKRLYSPPIVVASVASALEAEGWFVAVARMDGVDVRTNTSDKLGAAIGLAESPTVLLAGVAVVSRPPH